MKGSISWRNNNPGNLRPGQFSTRHGAIDESGGFAVFPDYESGYSALTSLLETKTYRNLTLEQAMNRYAPSYENHTDNYIKFIEKQTGFTRDTVLKEIPTNTVANAIQKFEGWIPGEE